MCIAVKVLETLIENRDLRGMQLLEVTTPTPESYFLPEGLKPWS